MSDLEKKFNQKKLRFAFDIIAEMEPTIRKFAEENASTRYQVAHIEYEADGVLVTYYKYVCGDYETTNEKFTIEQIINYMENQQ